MVWLLIWSASLGPTGPLAVILVAEPDHVWVMVDKAVTLVMLDMIEAMDFGCLGHGCALVVPKQSARAF